MKKICKQVKKSLGKICIVDRFLILFMLLLFAYMAIHLFVGASTTQETDTINIIIRTSAAAIFGYFISSNFVKTEPTQTPVSRSVQTAHLSKSIAIQPVKQIQKPRPETESAIVDNISEPADTSEMAPASAPHCSQIQVVIVSIIGFSSLIILMAARHFRAQSPELSATISQLRDFISACIGFLVSCGKSGSGTQA